MYATPGKNTARFFILTLNMLIIKSTWKNKQARVARKTLKEKASPTRPKNNIKTL